MSSNPDLKNEEIVLDMKDEEEKREEKRKAAKVKSNKTSLRCFRFRLSSKKFNLEIFVLHLKHLAFTSFVKKTNDAK
jgi:hypothetical protein